MLDRLYDQMYRIESRHWWFRAKRRIVLSLLEKFLGRDRSEVPAPRICDIGCGCGMMLSDLAGHGYDAVGMDASDKALGYCRSRGVSVVKGCLPDGIDLPRRSFDGVLMLDVLEHVAEDGAALASALELVKPSGVLICTVPAYGWMWSRFDEDHGHKRRYTRGRLKRVLSFGRRARIVLVSYMNAGLFPLAVVSRLLRRLLPASEGSWEADVPPSTLNHVLEEVFAMERFALLRGLRLPFGLSLVAVMRVMPAESPDAPVTPFTPRRAPETSHTGHGGSCRN